MKASDPPAQRAEGKTRRSDACSETKSEGADTGSGGGKQPRLKAQPTPPCPPAVSLDMEKRRTSVLEAAETNVKLVQQECAIEARNKTAAAMSNCRGHRRVDH